MGSTHGSVVLDGIMTPVTFAPGFNSMHSAHGIKVANLKPERLFWTIQLGLRGSEDFKGGRGKQETCWRGEAGEDFSYQGDPDQACRERETLKTRMFFIQQPTRELGPESCLELHHV